MGWKKSIFAGTGLGLIGTVLAGSAAIGQDASSERTTGATIYRDAAYRGPAVYVGGARSNLRLAWRVNSIRIYSGSWELCEKANYRGKCRTYTKDTPVIRNLLRGRTFQSIRPVGENFIGVEANNQVLRGASSEFHTQPDVRGFRIPACPSGGATSSCTKVTADNYCKSRGWDLSVNSESETINQRQFLADVLCTNNKG